MSKEFAYCHFLAHFRMSLDQGAVTGVRFAIQMFDKNIKKSKNDLKREGKMILRQKNLTFHADEELVKMCQKNFSKKPKVFFK